MPINTLEYAKLFQQQLDLQAAQTSVTGWMEANAGQVIYNGGDEVKIPKIGVQGLGDYDRDDGYVQGAVTYEYETRTLTQDRGRKFQLDAMDVDETNFGIAAANVMSEFQRMHVVPEIDAYRLSKLATTAITAGNSEEYDPNISTITSKFIEHIYGIADKGIPEDMLVAHISYPVYATLISNDEIKKQIDVVTFSSGVVETRVRSINGVVLIPTVSSRMKSAYVFYDGSTTGQEEGGFVPDDSAVDVNWIIMSRRAPIAVQKTDVIRIFDPMTYQKANAWGLDYRKYHDLWVLDNKVQEVFACVAPATP